DLLGGRPAGLVETRIAEEADGREAGRQPALQAGAELDRQLLARRGRPEHHQLALLDALVEAARAAVLQDPEQLGLILLVGEEHAQLTGFVEPDPEKREGASQ